MTVGKSAGVTDTGRKRRRNEDAFVREPPLFAVADGMGGAQAGEVASRLAAAAVRETDGDGTSGAERVAALIQEANRRVHRRSVEDPDASGMGTTMTVALVEGGLVWIGHVGDSRAYLLRDGRLEQLTDDHSLVAELVRSGKLPAEDAPHHPQRSVITRAVGTDPDVDVDTFAIEPKGGDVFLICSDGLTDMVDDETIRATVERYRGDPDAAARALVSAANRVGGEDNITVVIFEIADAAADPLEQTARLDAEPTEKITPEEDDTLSGLEAVPAVNTMVLAPGELDAALEREARRRQRTEQTERPSVAAALMLLVLVLLIAALVVWGLTR